MELFYKLLFKYRYTFSPLTRSFIFKTLLRIGGATIGKGIIPYFRITWPHQLQIKDNCQFETDIYFKFDGLYKSGPSIIIGNKVFIGRGCEFNIKKKITIGNDCLIGSGSKFIDHDHGLELNTIISNQPCTSMEIEIGNNVWLGSNVIILKGVKIEDGAVVGAGSIVNKSIPCNEIWVGIPAKLVGKRV